MDCSQRLNTNAKKREKENVQSHLQSDKWESKFYGEPISPHLR